MPNDAERSFELDERMYPLEAVQNAAYSFTDRAFVRVEPAAPGRLKVAFTLKPEVPEASRAALRGEFDNELLHQALRLRVSQANQKIREFIVTKALVSAQPATAVAQARAQAAPAGAAPSAEPCAECEREARAEPPAAPKIDPALEQEIDKLLAEIEGGDEKADPLGVTVPWEQKFGKTKKGKKK